MRQLPLVKENVVRKGCRSQDGLTRDSLSRGLVAAWGEKCGQSDENGCIPWLGSKTKKGYGTIRRAFNDKGTTAHRVAWVLANGDLAPGVLVLHRCDNPSCVNPDHLFSGSAKENTEDMVSKGRHAWRDGTLWQKLRISDVARIRFLRACGLTQQTIADQIGISRPLISMIEHGKIKHALINDHILGELS